MGKEGADWVGYLNWWVGKQSREGKESGVLGRVGLHPVGMGKKVGRAAGA